MVSRSSTGLLYRRNFRSRGGFSLVEMLVVIAILGVMAFIMIPQMKFDEIKDSRHRTNAQALASVCLAAQTAGIDFIVPGSVEDTIRAIVVGGSPAEGAMQSNWFGVPGLDDPQIDGAANFLSIENGMLVYDSGF